MASFLRNFARRFSKSNTPAGREFSLDVILAMVARTIPAVGRLTSREILSASIRIYPDGLGDIRLTTLECSTYTFPITLEVKSGAFASLTGGAVVLVLRADAVEPGMSGFMKALSR